MSVYYLTVFERNGEKLLDISFEAANDLEAKELCENKRKESTWADKPYRCTTSDGNLIGFKS